MTTVHVNGVSLKYNDTGGPGESIVFIHGLMLASASFAAQAKHFAKDYRVITFDLRGQGLSDKPASGLDLDTLADDVIALVEELDAGPCHLVGFSMGSFIAMRVAARRGDLVRSLALVGPTSEAEELPNRLRYAAMISFVRVFGPRLLASQMMKILFGSSYLTAAERAAERNAWQRELSGLPRSIARAASASASRKAITGELQRINAPTLVVSGEEDRPVLPHLAQKVQATISGAQFAFFPRTGHAVMIEQPDAFNRVLAQFLQQASVR